MSLNQSIFNIIEEQGVLKTTKSKPIVSAIKNRTPINFYYSGPRKPKKDSVKAGQRIKAEVVAMGLSKKGNLIVRAWVQPPSTSKKGFTKTGWRTFMVSRMSNVEILSDETFNNKRPQYKEGDDHSMSVTYVTSDWTKTPKTKKVEKPQPNKIKTTNIKTQPKPEVEPTNQNTVPTTNNDLPQPKPENKPNLKSIYKDKEKEWKDNQIKTNKPNLKPGEGTRKRLEKMSQTDLDKTSKPEVVSNLPQPKPETKPSKTPENNDNDVVNESIGKIKRLMFL